MTMRPTAFALHAKPSDLYTSTHELYYSPVPHPRGVQITARRSHLSQMDKDSVRCGAAAVPGTRFGVRARASIGMGTAKKNQWWSSGRRGRAAASRACRGAARTAERRGGEGASSLVTPVTHAGPRPRPRATGRSTSRPARGCRSTPRPRAYLHRFQCESVGAEETVGAGAPGGDAIQARTGTAGKQPRARSSGAGRCRHLARAPHASSGPFAAAA
jgi:hypothetical protein